jgi:predicted MFS family arabinose efflux permease
VALAQRVFVVGQGGGTGLGLIYGVAGVGTGLGPVLARRFTLDQQPRLRIALALSYLISILGVVITARMASFDQVLIGTFVRSFGGGINWVFSTQLLLALTPNPVRGRVFSSEFALFTLANAVGTAAGGWALDHTSMDLSGLMNWSAGLTLIPGLLWTWWVWRGMKRGLLSQEGYV